MCVCFSLFVSGRNLSDMNAVVIVISLLFVIGVQAQTSTAPLQILKYNWSKERIDWEKDPFHGTIEDFHDTRHRLRRERSVGSVLQRRSERAKQVSKQRQPAPARYAFNYKLLVHNTGQKAIKEIDWDYVFTDTVTREELGRREFTSVEEIEPGKRKELSILVSAPPSRRISVYNLGKRERDGLTEQVIVVRILYDDDSVWQAR